MQKSSHFFHSFAATIFLNFTLNSFCIFFMMAMKSFTIFHLIEKILWLLLSSLAIFTLCYSTEASHKAISDFSTLFCTYTSHDSFYHHCGCYNCCEGGMCAAKMKGINHRVEVLSELKGNFSIFFYPFSFTFFTDWNHSHENFHSKEFICIHLRLFRHQHESVAFCNLYVHYLFSDSVAI